MSTEKQKQIVAKNIKKLLDRKGKDQTVMAKELNFPETTVSNWMRAETYPRVDKLQLMADYFGVYRSDITEERANPITSLRSSDYNYYPTSISAGAPFNVDAVTNTDQITLPDAIMGKWAGHKDMVVMRINGESMNKVISNGSLIAIKTIELANLKDGDIVVFSNSNDYSVKRFYNDKQNERLLFRPDSTDNSFIDYSVPYGQTENLKIHGKVVVYIVELD